MKKIFSVILASVIMSSMLVFTGCNNNDSSISTDTKTSSNAKKTKVDLKKTFENVKKDFTDWYVAQSEDYTEEGAAETLDKVEIADDGSYISFGYVSGVSSSDSDAVKDFYKRLFELYVEEYFQLAKLINKELGFPDSVIKQMETTSALDGKQTYEGEKVSLSWSYSAEKSFSILYTLK